MDSAQTLLTRAQLLMQQRRFALAEEQLRTLLATQSQHALAHALLALCLVERETLGDAEAEANLAIHHAPDEAFGFYARSIVLHQKRDLPRAKEAIQEAIRIEPWESSFFARLAAIEHDAYQWQACLAAAEQGLACDPDDVECTNLRAIALVRLGRKAEAGRTIDAALAKQPESSTTHANQGWTLLHSGNAKQAMVHFREALRLQPNNEWARLGIIEAMKARLFLYRWLLKFFLWMTRFSPRTQVLLMLGIVFGHRILTAICEAVPALRPFEMPIIVAYSLFAWMTWIAPSLFNLVLFISPFGRMVLNRDEKLGAILVGSCIVTGLAIGGIGHLLMPYWWLPFWIVSLLLLGLAIPVSTILRFHGWSRVAMAAYSIGLVGAIAFTCWQTAKVINLGERALEMQSAGIDADDAWKQFDLQTEEFYRWCYHSALGIILSTWICVGLTVASRTRR